jgi:hypothetical protein
MWVLVVITGLVGAAAIVAGVQRERSAHALAGDGSGGSDAASGNAGASGTALDTAVASMRSGAWLVAIGFVVPAVLTAIAATASGQ